MDDAVRLLAHKIERLADGLSHLDPADKAALATIGAALEELQAEVDGEREELAVVLSACLEALQAIFLETVPDPHAALAAVLTAMRVAEPCVHLAPDDARDCLAEATVGVQSALGRKVDGPATGGDPPTTDGSEAHLPEAPAGQGE